MRRTTPRNMAAIPTLPDLKLLPTMLISVAPSLPRPRASNRLPGVLCFEVGLGRCSSPLAALRCDLTVLAAPSSGSHAGTAASDSGTDCFDRRFPGATRRSHRRQGGDRVPGPDSDGHLKKPAKTREELEAAIRLEMEDICEWPTDLAISIVPYEDSWKVSIMRDGPQPDADRCEMIEAIADRLRNQFDLKG